MRPPRRVIMPDPAMSGTCSWHPASMRAGCANHDRYRAQLPRASHQQIVDRPHGAYAVNKSSKDGATRFFALKSGRAIKRPRGKLPRDELHRGKLSREARRHIIDLATEAP
jgi:hypothetical protein